MMLQQQRAANRATSARPGHTLAFNSSNGLRRPQAHPRRGACATRVLDVTQETFADEVLKADKPVLVDFWAPWCGPCRLMAPLMDWVEAESGGALKVVKVEHDKSPALIEKYKVYGLPTLLLFKDGQEVAGSKREGAVTKPLLLEYLAQHGLAVVKAAKSA